MPSDFEDLGPVPGARTQTPAKKSPAATAKVGPETKVSVGGLSPQAVAAYNKQFPRESAEEQMLAGEQPWVQKVAAPAIRGLQKVGEFLKEDPSKPWYRQSPQNLAVQALDFPLHGPWGYGPRAALGKIHEKVIEPQRERTEQEFGEAIKSGAGAAGLEAYMPMPSRNVFMPVMETAIYPSLAKMTSRALRAIPKAAVAAGRFGELPEATWAATKPPTALVGATAPKTSVEAAEAAAKAALVDLEGGAVEAAPAAAAAAPVAAPAELPTPSFLQPPTTPWAAGMTHPRLRGLTEGGYAPRPGVPPRQPPVAPVPLPSPRQPSAHITQEEFELARMGGRGFAPPAAAQFVRTKEIERATKIVHQIKDEVGPYGKGTPTPEARRTLRIIENLDKLGGMGLEEELPWQQRLLDSTRKHF